MNRSEALAVAVVAGGVIFLVGATALNNKPSTPHVVGTYEQTWTVPYTATSCTQWLGSMNSHQRFVAAHDLAARLGAYDRSDAFATTFETDVTNGCGSGVAGIGLSDVAAGIATLDTTDFS